MESSLIQRLIGTLVTSAILWLFGILSAKAPVLVPIVQKMIDTAGGMEVVTLGIAGFLLTLLFALWRRLVSYWKLHVAGQLPAGLADPKAVDQVYKEASYSDVIKMRVPTQAKARQMLISAQKKNS